MTLTNKILTAICILLIIPFLVLSFYNHPSADDFCNTNLTIKHGVVHMTKWWYFNWSGRYFSNFLASANPLILGNLIVYNLIPIITLISTILILYIFLKQIIESPTKIVFLLSLITYTSILITKPTISEGIYWYTSIVTYEFANIYILLIGICMLKYALNNKLKYFILAILFSVLLIGSNETSMIIYDTIIFVITIFTYKREKTLVLLTAIALFFSIIVVIAPGNQIRGAYFTNSHLINYSLYQTILFFRNNILNWITIPSITILLISFNTKISIDLPIYKSIIILALIPLVGIFPGFWAMGTISPERSINVIHFIFTVTYVVTFIKIIEPINLHLTTSNNILKYFITAILIILIISNVNVRSLIKDLASGNAAEFSKRKNERINEIKKNKKANDFRFKKITNIPSTIFVSDLDSNKTDWKNKCFCEFYKIKNVTVY